MHFCIGKYQSVPRLLAMIVGTVILLTDNERLPVTYNFVVLSSYYSANMGGFRGGRGGRGGRGSPFLLEFFFLFFFFNLSKINVQSPQGCSCIVGGFRQKKIILSWFGAMLCSRQNFFGPLFLNFLDPQPV